MLADPQTWIALLTLCTLEIVLGVDNLVFISIAVSKLPHAQRERARRFGIALACVTRIRCCSRSPTSRAWTRADLFTLFGPGLLDPRPGADRRRRVPRGQGRDGDPRPDRGRADARTSTRAPAEFVRRGDRADRADRHRVLARFGDHRGRHGRAVRAGDGRGDHAGGRRDVVASPTAGRLHRQQSDHQDAGAGLHHPGRRRADRRGLRHPHRARLCVLRHGVLGAGRIAEPVGQAARQAQHPSRIDARCTPAPGDAAMPTDRSPTECCHARRIASAPACCSLVLAACSAVAATTRSSRRTRRSRPAGPR